MGLLELPENLNAGKKVISDPMRVIWEGKKSLSSYQTRVQNLGLPLERR